MSDTPFLPLWVGDFVRDTLDLDTTEIGAYMLILMAQWSRDGRSLPADKLRRVARCGRNWPRVWGTIGRFFEQDRDGVYSKRLRLEAQSVAAKREVNRRSGALGGAANALKNNKAPLANAVANSVAKGQRKASISESEPYKKDVSNDTSKESADALAAFNETAGSVGWPKVQRITAARRSRLAARLRDAGGLDGWLAAVQRAAGSDFLTGRTAKPFTASFDWLTTEANFAKLMEGNYDNRAGSGSHPTVDAIALAGRSRKAQEPDWL